MIKTIIKAIKIMWGTKFIMVFVIFPLLFALLPFFITISLPDISGNFISGLSLFVGLLFTLIITLSDKVQTKKDALENTSDAGAISTVNAYINFAEKAITIITATVYIGLFLMVLLLLSQLQLVDIYDYAKNSESVKIKITNFNIWWAKIVMSIITFLGMVFLLFITYILKLTHDFFYGQVAS